MRIVIGGATGLIGTALAAEPGAGRPSGHPAGPAAPRGAGPGPVGSGPRARWTRPCSAAATAWSACPARPSRAAGGPRPASGSCATAGSARPPTLVTAIAAAAASAAGAAVRLGHRLVRRHRRPRGDETAPAGDGFLAGLVTDWEAAAAAGPRGGHPGRALRSGLVLSGQGGLLGPLPPLFRLGLGARLGTGRQYLSWIALADHVRAARFLLEHRRRRAGQPDRARAGHQRRVHRRAGPRRAPPGRARGAGAGAARRPGRGVTELLGSARVRPARLLAAGFTFQYPSIDAALAAAVG